MVMIRSEEYDQHDKLLINLRKNKITDKGSIIEKIQNKFKKY